MADPLLLTIEPPLILSPSAKRGLDEARRKTTDRRTEDDVTKLDVLERAWLDEQRSVKSSALPMSTQLQKLWAERGDFSRFRASELLAKKAAGDGDDDTAKQDEVGEDLGVNLDGLLDSPKQTKDEQKEGTKADGREQKDGEDDEDGREVATKGDIMSIEDMRELRRRMLEKLGVAQNSLYFSHALVSLLINSTKQSAGQDGASMLRGDPTMRAGSVASTSGVAAQHARAAAASASGMQRSAVSGAQATMGSASTLEAELGIEPYVFGASRLEAQRRDVERPPEDVEDDAAMVDDEEDADEEETAAKKAARIAKQDAKLLDNEVEEQARDLAERFESKRQGISAAVSILRKGSMTIHPDNEGAGRDRVRWQALMHAKRAGWSLTPDKPIRGTAAKKRELLEDFQRRHDEPARDAWIGYAVPEQSPAYRRRALAYLSHSSTQADRPVDALLFASRPEKRMHVEIVVGGDETWTSGDEGRQADGSTSDANARTLDGMLRLAQSELVDTELFDTLVAECRALSAAGIAKVTIDDEDSASVEINPITTLRFVRVATTTAAAAADATQEQAADADRAQDEKASEGQRHSSPLVACILAMLRLALLCRYRERAGLQARITSRVASSALTSTGKSGSEEDVHAPLLQPLLGLLHYASFVARLHAILAGIKEPYPRARFDLDGFSRIGDGGEWLELLLQQPGKNGRMAAVRQLGGSAMVALEDGPIAFLSFTYPSRTSLTLPRKESSNGAGTGVHLASVELSSLKGILMKELARTVDAH